MTDNRSLLERAEEWQDHPVKANQQWPLEIRGLILGLAAALRTADRDLATARTLASEAAASGRFDALLGHLLASVPPPTSGEEP